MSIRTQFSITPRSANATEDRWLYEPTVPFEKNGIRIEQAKAADLRDMLDAALRTKTDANSTEKLEQILTEYTKVFPHASFLVARSPEGNIVGSQGIIYKTPSISFGIEKDLENHLETMGSSAPPQAIFYGLGASIDKNYFDKANASKNAATELWKTLLLKSIRKITPIENSVLVTHIEKDALGVVNKVLGMPWQQIGDQVPWSSTPTVPAMITSEQLNKWVGDHVES